MNREEIYKSRCFVDTCFCRIVDAQEAITMAEDALQDIPVPIQSELNRVRELITETLHDTEILQIYLKAEADPLIEKEKGN